MNTKIFGASSLTKLLHIIGALFCFAYLIPAILTESTFIRLLTILAYGEGALILYDVFVTYSMTAGITVYLDEAVLPSLPSPKTTRYLEKKWAIIYSGTRKGLNIKEILTIVSAFILSIVVPLELSMAEFLCLIVVGLSLSCIASEIELSRMKKMHRIKEEQK